MPRKLAVVVSGAAAGVLAAVAVVPVIHGARSAPEPARGVVSQSWSTRHVGSVVVSLPMSFRSTQSPAAWADYVAAKSDDPLMEQVARSYRQVPQAFVLGASQSLSNAGQEATVVISRWPSGGLSLRERAAQSHRITKRFGVRILDQAQVVVGRGRYRAVRYEGRANLAGTPTRGVSYLVDGGAQVWIVDCLAPAQSFKHLSPVFDRLMSSFTRPYVDE